MASLAVLGTTTSPVVRHFRRFVESILHAILLCLHFVQWVLFAPVRALGRCTMINRIYSLSGRPQPCIVPISKCDRIKIYILSVLCALWTIAKRILRNVWSSSSKHGQSEKRGSPPFCLIDTVLGLHSNVKLKEVKLHYVESGNRDKPLLLLLHGFPDCWISWRGQISALSPYFRVVAIDLKGFGDSDKPLSSRSYRLPDLVVELRELITALGARTCSVVGHDLGALLGWYLVHRFPDAVTKFVAISCPHPNVFWTSLPKASAFNSSWVYLCQLPRFAETEALNNDLKIIDHCYQHLRNNKGQEAYLEAYKYSFSRREDWKGAINYYRNLPFWRVDEGSGPVPVPTMLMMGNKDPWVDMESIIKSTDFVEKLSVKVIEGAGHFPHQERPDLVNKNLLAFLVDRTPVEAIEKERQSAGLVNRLYSSTLWFSGQMLDTVQKSTKLPMPTKYFALGQGSG